MPVTHGGAIFAAARGLQCDWREILDFSASINPLGPSPFVRPALVQAIDEITHYPDPYATRLRMALAREWDVDPRRIFVGNGATELIHFLARVWRIETTLITPVFSEFHRAYPKARVNEWPDDELVVVSNPVNPTGSAGHFRSRHRWTLVDESFIEFTDLPTRMHEEHCVVLRSLTKFHALPGLRIGALVGPIELMDELRPAREPWQVNVLAEAAALAAVADKEHQRRSKEFIAAERHRLWEVFANLPGVELQPTHANYYFAKLRYRAGGLCEFLYQRKVLIRDCTCIPGVEGESVRFAIRSREDNDRLLELWRTYPCD